MKKIMSIILLSTISLGSFAEGIFNMQIPQPDFVSNDWDGDGEPNSTDDDDDDDGTKDVNDSTPFGGSPGRSIVTEIVVPDYVYPGYTGDTCEDDGLILQATATELNLWSGYNNTTSSWCTTKSINPSPWTVGVTVPEVIGALTNLTSLYIINNGIKNIPESIGNLTNLTYLSLYNNKIAVIPESIGNLKKLTSLFLNNNNIENVPSNIMNLKLLNNINLSSNHSNSNFNNIDCSKFSTCLK